MLQPATLTFLTHLKANNNKGWFEANRPAYEAARADFVALATDAIAGLERLDPALKAAGLVAKSCVFRINRDVRFSADKSPYKSNFSAWFNAGGKHSAAGGYYLHLEPGGSFVAGGMYQPEPAVLAAIRQEIDYNLPAFQALLAQPAFSKYYDGLSTENALQRPPKGYEADNPAIEFLKLKSFVARHPLSDKDLTSKHLVATVDSAFVGLQPLVQFLNKSLPD